MVEVERKRLPIDPESVARDSHGCIIAHGRNKYAGKIFMHSQAAGKNLTEAQGYLYELRATDRSHDYVIGVGVNSIRSFERGRIVYDHTRLDLWIEMLSNLQAHELQTMEVVA